MNIKIISIDDLGEYDTFSARFSIIINDLNYRFKIESFDMSCGIKYIEGINNLLSIKKFNKDFDIQKAIDLAIELIREKEQEYIEDGWSIEHSAVVPMYLFSTTENHSKHLTFAEKSKSVKNPNSGNMIANYIYYYNL